jgi:hypothetical protein
VDLNSIPANSIRDSIVGFAYHPQILLAATGDDGGGLIELDEWDEKSDMIGFRVRYPNGNVSHMAVLGVHQLKQFAGQDASRGVGDPAAIFRALILARAGQELRCDVLVTSDSYLLETAHPNLVGRANPTSPGDALALIGLFLRSRGDFTYWRSRHASARYNSGLFYWVLTRELLLSSWSWFSACVSNMTHTGDPSAEDLGESILRRVDRALRARDRIHIELKLVQSNDTADEVLFYFDVMVLMLVGAYDAAARLAHIVYQLPGDRSDASWRRSRWLHVLGRADPNLAALMAPGAKERDALELVAMFRNYIHGEAPRSLAYQVAARPRENLIVVPEAERTTIEHILDRRGGKTRWGYRLLTADRATLDPHPYIEALWPLVLESLDTVTGQIKAERLPRVVPSEVLGGRPSDETFSPEIGRLLKLLAGL